MTIKQQGGIFGRNPTFNNVTVDAELGVGTNDPARTLHVNSGAVDIAALFESTDDPVVVSFWNGTGGGNIKVEGSNFNFRTGGNSTGAGGTNRLTVASSGDVTVETGNLVIGTSGKGIDFSATSGTGTSELFSDYEEGSWSPVLNDYEGTPIISGYYVKIGQMVHLECSIELDGTVDGSGYIITNLPFSAASPYFGGGTLVQNDGGVTDLLVRMDSSSYLRIHNSSNVIQSYFAVGASSTIVINAQYRAA